MVPLVVMLIQEMKNDSQKNVAKIIYFIASFFVKESIHHSVVFFCCFFFNFRKVSMYQGTCITGLI